MGPRLIAHGRLQFIKQAFQVVIEIDHADLVVGVEMTMHIADRVDAYLGFLQRADRCLIGDQGGLQAYQ
ncbi:hypothetical protein D3C87_2020610 [compost metagenome]